MRHFFSQNVKIRHFLSQNVMTLFRTFLDLSSSSQSLSQSSLSSLSSSLLSSPSWLPSQSGVWKSWAGGSSEEQLGGCAANEPPVLLKLIIYQIYNFETAYKMTFFLKTVARFENSHQHPKYRPYMNMIWAGVEIVDLQGTNNPGLSSGQRGFQKYEGIKLFTQSLWNVKFG